MQTASKLAISSSLLFMICAQAQAQAQAQEEIINACRDLAASALRTYTTFRDDKAFLAVTYADVCSTKQSYEALSSSSKATFDAAYSRVFSLGYGSDSANASVKDNYAAFCSKNSTDFRSDQSLFSEAQTIKSDALNTVNLCLKSAEANIKVNYKTPTSVEDNLTVTFQARIGSQLLNGVSSRNAVCTYGSQPVSSEITPPLAITSNAISITCVRRSEPIQMYGLTGTRYPRGQVTFFTNYSDSALDIILPEGVTGPLENRLSDIEKKLSEDTIFSNSFVFTQNQCPTPNYEDVTAQFSGRYIYADDGVKSEITLGGNDGSHQHSGGSHTHTVEAVTYGDGGIREGSRNREAAAARGNKVSGTAAAATVALDGGSHLHSYVGMRVCRKK